MRAGPRTASIVIPCYNYGKFVASAIESALRQTRPAEVIVVDDGSTDDSGAVIRRFSDRVRAVFKENGGHGSAVNAGCRLATGDAVLVLDADDELHPEAVETVLGAWRPETVLVQWRVSMMDAEGRDIAGTVPAPWVRLDEGDMRAQMLATGGFAVTVMSGLAWRRDVLLGVLPIPEERFREAAEGYLVRAMAFLGPVQAVDRPLTRYRRHGASQTSVQPTATAAVFRKRLRWAREEFDLVKSLAREHGLEAAADLGEQSPGYLRLRLYSVATDSPNHPIRSDTRSRLLPRIIAAGCREATTLRRRLLNVAFDTTVGFAPSPLSRRLLAWRHAPRARPRP